MGKHQKYSLSIKNLLLGLRHRPLKKIRIKRTDRIELVKNKPKVVANLRVNETAKFRRCVSLTAVSLVLVGNLESGRQDIPMTNITESRERGYNPIRFRSRTS